MLEFEIAQTALQLQTLIKSSGRTIRHITIKPNQIVMDDSTACIETVRDGKVPIIERLLKDVGVNPDMCLECMTDDNMKNSEFFVHLMRAYIHFLILKYGPTMPISREMANYFLRHDLLDLYVIYSVEHMKVMNKGDLDSKSFYYNDSFILTYEE